MTGSCEHGNEISGPKMEAACSSERLYLSAVPYGVTTKKINTDIFTAVITSNPTCE
jgi:hypothetical protein